MQTLIDRIRSYCVPLEPVPTEAEPQTTPIEGVRAVVFDVYGTLLISGVGDIGLAQTADRGEAIQQAIEAIGLTVADEVRPLDLSETFLETVASEQNRRRETGIEYPEVDIRSVWTRCIQEWRVKGWVDWIITPESIEHLAVEYECRVNPVWSMPGLTEILQWLPMQGYALGIVSNAQFFTPLLFQALLHQSVRELHFPDSHCVWSYECLEAKPSTRLYERLAETLLEEKHIPPEAVIYIGNDRRNDVWPAARVGFRTVLFAGDQRSLRTRVDDPRLRDVQPDAVITDLRQLKVILQPD